MAQQFDYPKTETQLREIQDKLYQHSKEARDAGDRPAFKGLLEIMSAEVTIITAIHNIKSNHGSETPGVDSKTMRNDYLHNPFSWVVNDIQSAFRHYEPQKIRRVYIDKPGKSEKRPLGIPTIRDRIVQECMRIVLEPIFEAQFFAHSYGFRPMRDAPMALERTKELVFNTGYYWIVEGDISKCFDRIDHSILLKRLYHMGVKDRRVLQIIKAMLKAGVMDECEVNAEGTPQELEQAIFRCHHAQPAESDTPPAPPVPPKTLAASGGVSYAQARRTRREPPPPVVIRTDGGQE